MAHNFFPHFPQNFVSSSFRAAISTSLSYFPSLQLLARDYTLSPSPLGTPLFAQSFTIGIFSPLALESLQCRPPYPAS
jgi:hypothetical protein